MNMWQNIWAVARRELQIWLKRPIYVTASLVTMLFCTVFFVTFLRDGLPEKLPIGIVDGDRSTLSRNIIRQIDATQLGRVVEYDTYADARADMQRGVITSVLVFPDHMYADVLASRQPTVTFYVNGLYFVGGSLAYKDLMTMVNTAAGGIKRETLRARGMNEHAVMGLIRPIDIDTHQIGNPMTNYGVYLNNMLLPGVLEMIVILVLVYSLGAELKYGTSRHLMETAGGSMRDALGGKLLVYTVWFTVLGFTMELFLYKWLHYPMAGSVWNMLLAVLLLVLASEAVAILIIGAIPSCRLAISIAALFSVLGFSLAGFTLPVESMPGPIQGLSMIFPLRHYYLFYVQEAIFGAGFAGWWAEAVRLLVFLLLPALVVRRLEGAFIKQNYPQN